MASEIDFTRLFNAWEDLYTVRVSIISNRGIATGHIGDTLYTVVCVEMDGRKAYELEDNRWILLADQFSSICNKCVKFHFKFQAVNFNGALFCNKAHKTELFSAKKLISCLKTTNHLISVTENAERRCGVTVFLAIRSTTIYNHKLAWTTKRKRALALDVFNYPVENFSSLISLIKKKVHNYFTKNYPI